MDYRSNPWETPEGILGGETTGGYRTTSGQRICDLSPSEVHLPFSVSAIIPRRKVENDGSK